MPDIKLRCKERHSSCFWGARFTGETDVQTMVYWEEPCSTVEVYTEENMNTGRRADYESGRPHKGDDAWTMDGFLRSAKKIKVFQAEGNDSICQGMSKHVTFREVVHGPVRTLRARGAAGKNEASWFCVLERSHLPQWVGLYKGRGRGRSRRKSGNTWKAETLVKKAN